MACAAPHHVRLELACMKGGMWLIGNASMMGWGGVRARCGQGT